MDEAQVKLTIHGSKSLGRVEKTVQEGLIDQISKNQNCAYPILTQFEKANTSLDLEIACINIAVCV